MEAPPTPPVPLAALLADRELGLRHLAGPAEADVHGVHASEMADPRPTCWAASCCSPPARSWGPTPTAT